jgi:hypothetical protein
MNASGPGPKPVAAVITEWREGSHADVILSRLLEPEAWGHTRPFALRLAAVYADQFPENDLCRALCARHGVPIFPTITGAVGVGTRAVPVEGVIVVGEHGRYATNARQQKLYPRRRLFDEVVHAFRVLGRRVPVFSDKHLSYDWLFARWMYDLARHEGIPFMAGSSLPVAWRVPALTLPIGAELTGAFALGYADLDAYGFHALETLQCMVERRAGGETGVASVRCVSGPAVWEGAESGLWPRDLLDALEPARRAASPKARDVRPLPGDTLFLIRYADGLEASVAMLDSVGECFGFAARRRGVDSPEAAVFDLQNGHPFGHFGYLLRAIEHLIQTGRPAYPVERTLLTSGLLSALLQSRSEGGTNLPTPHLAEIRYQPAEWPFAPGPTGNPA